MVLELQFWHRFRFSNLIVFALFMGVSARAAETAQDYLRDAQSLYRSGQYFKAARYAFQAKELDPALTSEAYSWITLGLTRAQLYQSASYFFIRTLQVGNSAAIRRVLTESEVILLNAGEDLLRKYLVRHTRYEDYDPVRRGAYLYALGRAALLRGEFEQAVGYLNGVDAKSSFYPFALQLRGSAYAIAGKNNEALQDFSRCAQEASHFTLASDLDSDAAARRRVENEAQDLKARCLAGKARTLYQIEKFEEADQTYDQIAKSSLVWPDILFEQAWNSFARREYNRTLGKLVSYKSPALSFVFNPEVDVLRAQTYLALCLYDDANQVIQNFSAQYERMGEQIKTFVETNSNRLNVFYEAGERALKTSIYSPGATSVEGGLNWVLNRFVRGPYFKGLYLVQQEIGAEALRIRNYDAADPENRQRAGRGFPGFLNQVLQWRSQSIRSLGGVFIKNSLMDHYSEFLSSFDKMSFIKLEMLKRAKERLIYRNIPAPRTQDRSRGNVKPERRDYQYYWSFNGEFWNDELGDYVFGLESACKGVDGV